MLKNFLMKQMIKSQLKDVPEAEKERILDMVEKNPDLFEKIAKESQEAMKSGKDQMSAVMGVMMKYQDQLKGIMKKN